MSVPLATEVQITPTTATQVAPSSFGAESFQTMNVATVQIETIEDADCLRISTQLMSPIPYHF